jgi:hypothetical protein
MTNPEGRPTKYNEAFIDKVQEYLNACQDEEFERGEDKTVLYKLRVKLPTIEGFARYIGVHKDTLYEWCKVHPEFSDSLVQIKTEQMERLINNGLNGDYNPTIAKLILSSNHGMREKTETDVTSKGESIVAKDVAVMSKEEVNAYLKSKLSSSPGA